MEKFIKRLIEEHKELNSKIIKLSTKLTSVISDCSVNKSNISIPELSELYHQLKVMQEYRSCLERRLTIHNVGYIDGKYITTIE